MKTLRATTAKILLLCLIFIEQNIAEHASQHDVVSHHQDAQRRHHTPPSGIQAPHELEPSPSRVSCISADSNIYEIFHKANGNCRGNDFSCTFYHYSDRKYHNLGTIDLNRELFDILLAKYENWLITPEPIDENNGEDSNHKVRLKGADKIVDQVERPCKDNNKLAEINNNPNPIVPEAHYRRHKAKFTGDQKARYKNGERVCVDPKFNKEHKYYELFLPKDKHKGDPRTIYVDIDTDQDKHVLDEKIDKELNKDVNDKPIKVELDEHATDHKEHNRKNIHHHRSTTNDNKIEGTEHTNNIEVKESSQEHFNPNDSTPSVINFNDNQTEASNYPTPVSLDTKIGNNDKNISDIDHENDSEDDDDENKSHRIHLIESNKYHNDLNAENFTYKRTDTLQLNEPVFQVENPRKLNNMHVFSLPEYTGHHSVGISDYTGYKDLHLNPHDGQDQHSLPDHGLSLPDFTVSSKDKPVSFTNPNLPVTDKIFPGHIRYYPPKSTVHNIPQPSHGGSPPILSSSLETAKPNFSPKYSPYNFGLRSSPFSRLPEMLTPCQLNSLTKGTIFSPPSLGLSNEVNSQINLLSLPLGATKSFEDSNSFKSLPSVNPETTFFNHPCPLDITTPPSIDSISSNNLLKSFESISSHPSITAMPSPINSNLGANIYQHPQMLHPSPYTQYSTPNMNLELLKNLQQSSNFGQPIYNQNSIFSPPSRNIFNNNPYINRPQSTYPCAEPFNKMASYLSGPGSAINSPLSAYSTNSILNGNNIPGTISNAFLPLSPVNQISPLSLMLQRPNYITPSPCPNAPSMSPYNIPLLNQGNLLNNYHQVADNLATLQGVDSLSPLQNIPLSVLDHPYTMTPSNYLRPTQSICSSLKPITIQNALQNLLETQGETSSYSELAHLTDKPCLNLENQPLSPMIDDSLIGEHLSPNKPTVYNSDLNVNDESIDTDELTPIDYSLVDSDSDNTHIQINTTVSFNELPLEDHLDTAQDSNVILDSTLTEPETDTVPPSSLDDDNTTVNITSTITIETEPTVDDEATVPEFDSSLIDSDLPISSEDSIVTEVDENEDSSLTDFVPLVESDDVESELEQSEIILQEISDQTDVEYSDFDESILPSNLTEETDVDNLEPLDSSLIDTELDFDTETVDHEIEPHTLLDNLPDTNVSGLEDNVLPSSLIPPSLEAKIDLKPEAESPQPLVEPDITINIHTTINITDSGPDVLEPELIEGEEKPEDTELVGDSILPNEETEFTPLDEPIGDFETIPTKDNETIKELEPEEFIPPITSGMNIPIEDMATDILPTNELNSSLVEPSLELTEELDTVPGDTNLTSDLIGPTILNETSDAIDSEELDSSLTEPTLEGPTIPQGIEPSEMTEPSDIIEPLINDNMTVLPIDAVTDEDSNTGPSILTPELDSENLPEDDSKKVIPISEPPINVESNLAGPSLLPQKDTPENLPALEPNSVLESSLVDSDLDSIINAPEMANNSDTEINFDDTLLVKGINEPEWLRSPESDVKLDDETTGPNLVNETDLVEEPVLDSEKYLDDSLTGPDLTRKTEPKVVKPEFDQTNSVMLDSALIDNLLSSEKVLNAPTSREQPSSIPSSAGSLPSNLRREGIPSTYVSPICPNPLFEPKYTGPQNFFPYMPHDLTNPTLSKILHQPTSPLLNPCVPKEVTPIPSNSYLEALKPIKFSKLPDLYLPATPYKYVPQYSLPCENLLGPSSLTSSILNNRFPPSILNLPTNILNLHNSPLYSNSIPYSPLSPLKLPSYNIPHAPFSNPYLKPENLQSITNPLVLNALLNNPHLQDVKSSYTPLQAPKYDQIGSILPNLHNIPNNYLQALNGIPFNLQQLKPNIPCVPQIINQPCLSQVNLQELESPPTTNVQNIPALPALKPVNNQVPSPCTLSPTQTEESESLFDTDSENYDVIESELNSFIQEAENDQNFLETLVNEDNYETLEEQSELPCEKVEYQTLQEDKIEKYVPEASLFNEPLNSAKEELNLQETEFIKLEPELNIPVNKPIDLPSLPPPKYIPNIEEQVCFAPFKEADLPIKYQLLEPIIDAQTIKPGLTLKNIPKLQSTEQFHSNPYEMLPEPTILPIPRPIAPCYPSPSSYAKPNAASYLSPYLSPGKIPPCLQEYTSPPATEYLPATNNLRPVPPPVSYRPSTAYGSPYTPEYPSPSFIDSIPIEAKESPKIAVPCKQTYASPCLPTLSTTPSFETSIPIESSNLPISQSASFTQPELKELPILPTPLKPLSVTPLTPAESLSPSYYSPVSTPCTESPFINPANILTEPPSLPSVKSTLPCLRPLPETHPIYRELMANPQFMKALNIQPMLNNIYPWTNFNRKIPSSPMAPTLNHPIKSIPYEIAPINMEILKNNELSEAVSELNLQKQKPAPTEVWTSYDETNSYVYSNDSGNKVHEDIPESNLESVTLTLEGEDNTYTEVNEHLPSVPLETQSYATEIPALQTPPITVDSSKNNVPSAAILESNSQELETAAPSEVCTTDNTDVVSESNLESIPYTLESEENVEVNESPICTYTELSKPKLNQERPISYSQVKEPVSYPPILEAAPQRPDKQWLPLANTADLPTLLPPSILSKPCPKLSPYIPLLNQSPYLQSIPYFPSFSPSPMISAPCKNKVKSLPYSSSSYHPPIVEEYSEIPSTAPCRNYTPLLPNKSNALENFVPAEAMPYLPTTYSSPYTRLPFNNIPLPNYLPSPCSYTKYQPNMIPFRGLPISPAASEQFKNISPLTASPCPTEYTPIQSPICTPPPLKSLKPIPSPLTTSALPSLPLEETPILYEPYSTQPGLSYSPKPSNIIEHLPPLKESPICYEPAPLSPGFSKSPYSSNIENLPFTVSLSSDDTVKPAPINLSPSNYASYSSPLEYIEASPCLPYRPSPKLISPQNVLKPRPQSPLEEYTIPSSFSDTIPPETYSSYESQPVYEQYISRPSPKLQLDLSKYLPVDDNPCQMINQPYTPINKVQTPSNVEYISESSPLLKPTFKGYSLPFGNNVRLPCLYPNYVNFNRPSNIINTPSPTLINPFIKEFKDIPITPLSVPSEIIPSAPIESNILSPASNPLDKYEEYIEPCPLKPLQSLSLLKPLMTSSKEPAELQNIPSFNANIPQYISPYRPLLKQLLTNAYNRPLFVPQNYYKPTLLNPEIDLEKLSKHQPIICHIDETVNPNAPTISKSPEMVAPCDLQAPVFSQYQSLTPTEKLSPISMTPSSPLLTSSYQEISPTEIAESLPNLNFRPSPSSTFIPPYRPSKLTPIPPQYGPKSIIENAPDIANICPVEMPSYSKPTLVETSPCSPEKSNNIQQIRLDGFPISELFEKAPNVVPYNPPSISEVPKTPKYQNSLPKESAPWVLINNENVDDKNKAKLTPCEYISQTSENPIETEYLKLAKLLSEAKPPQTEYEKYEELPEESQYEELPSSLKDETLHAIEPDNKTPKTALHFPQNLANLENFYTNNHIGKSPIICYVNPTPNKPLTNFKHPCSKVIPDIITNLNEIPSTNIELPSESNSNFITPNEYLPTIPGTYESSPISLNTNYLQRPTFKSPQMKYLPNPVEYLPENQYSYPLKDSIENIKYSGYKTYQLPTLKSAEKSLSEMYYPCASLSPCLAPKPPIPCSYLPTANPKTNIPHYQTLEYTLQPKSDLSIQPQSPNFNNYNPIDNIPVKADNFDNNNEIKNSIINYINNKGFNDKLCSDTKELTIPIGDIAITKREPHIAKILPTGNPSIGLKVWKSNVKLVKAELKLKFNEVSVNNFMPILNNLNDYDMEEIRKIIKAYIDERYGEHIEIHEPYTIDNQYTVIKDLNRDIQGDKFNLLWPTYYV